MSMPTRAHRASYGRKLQHRKAEVMYTSTVSEMATTDAAAATTQTDAKPTAGAEEVQAAWLEDCQADWGGNNMVSEGDPNC